jgi:hypothetical protein
MVEPGVDRHEWQSEWQALEEQLADSPAERLPELDELVGRILEARGLTIDDPAAAEGEELEIVAEFLAARETTTESKAAPTTSRRAISRQPSTATGPSSGTWSPRAARRSGSASAVRRSAGTAFTPRRSARREASARTPSTARSPAGRARGTCGRRIGTQPRRTRDGSAGIVDCERVAGSSPHPIDGWGVGGLGLGGDGRFGSG